MLGKIIIRCGGFAGPFDCPHVGQYLVGCDVDANGGRGEAMWSTDPAEAMVFDHISAATAYYMRQSSVVPLRDDARPNRPLTAYNIGLEPVGADGLVGGVVW